MHNKTELPNFHILTVKYISQTDLNPSKVKIISERFKESITFSYNSDRGDTLNQAEIWLIDNGHKIVGHGEGKGHSYVICDHVNGSFTKLREKLVSVSLMGLVGKKVAGVRAQVTNANYVGGDTPPMWRTLEEVATYHLNGGSWVRATWEMEYADDIGMTGCLQSQDSILIQFREDQYIRMLNNSK